MFDLKVGDLNLFQYIHLSFMLMVSSKSIRSLVIIFERLPQIRRRSALLCSTFQRILLKSIDFGDVFPWRLFVINIAWGDVSPKLFSSWRTIENHSRADILLVGLNRRFVHWLWRRLKVMFLLPLQVTKNSCRSSQSFCASRGCSCLCQSKVSWGRALPPVVWTPSSSVLWFSAAFQAS